MMKYVAYRLGLAWEILVQQPSDNYRGEKSVGKDSVTEHDKILVFQTRTDGYL
jgi:hypothetical protein